MGFIPTDENIKAPEGWINSAGKYNLRIVEVEKKISSAGNPMKEIILESTETGQKIRDRLVETEKAFWKIAIFAKACGVKIARGSELDVDKTWAGKKLTVNVVMGEAGTNGKSYAEIDSYDYDEHASLFSDDAPTKPESTESKKW